MLVLSVCCLLSVWLIFQFSLEKRDALKVWQKEFEGKANAATASVATASAAQVFKNVRAQRWHSNARVCIYPSLGVCVLLDDFTHSSGQTRTSLRPNNVLSHSSSSPNSSKKNLQNVEPVFGEWKINKTKKKKKKKKRRKRCPVLGYGQN